MEGSISDTEDSKFRIVASASLRIVSKSNTTNNDFDDVDGYQYSAFIRRYQDEDIDNSSCPSYYFTVNDADHTSIVLTSQMVLEPSWQIVKQQHTRYVNRCRHQKRIKKDHPVDKTLSVHDSFHKVITLHHHLSPSIRSSTVAPVGGETRTSRSLSITIEFESEVSYFLWHRLFRFALANLTLSDCLNVSRVEEAAAAATVSPHYQQQHHLQQQLKQHHQQQQHQQQPGMDISHIGKAVIRCQEWVSPSYPLLQRTIAIRHFKARLIQLATQLQSHTHTQLIAMKSSLSSQPSSGLSISPQQLSSQQQSNTQLSIYHGDCDSDNDNKENQPNPTIVRAVRSSQSNDMSQSIFPVKSPVKSVVKLPVIDEFLRLELTDVLTRLAV